MAAAGSAGAQRRLYQLELPQRLTARGAPTAADEAAAARYRCFTAETGPGIHQAIEDHPAGVADVVILRDSMVGAARPDWAGEILRQALSTLPPHLWSAFTHLVLPVTPVPGAVASILEGGGFTFAARDRGAIAAASRADLQIVPLDVPIIGTDSPEAYEEGKRANAAQISDLVGDGARPLVILRRGYGQWLDIFSGRPSISRLLADVRNVVSVGAERPVSSFIEWVNGPRPVSGEVPGALVSPLSGLTAGLKTTALPEEGGRIDPAALDEAIRAADRVAGKTGGWLLADMLRFAPQVGVVAGLTDPDAALDELLRALSRTDPVVIVDSAFTGEPGLMASGDQHLNATLIELGGGTGTSAEGTKLGASDPAAVVEQATDHLGAAGPDEKDA